MSCYPSDFHEMCIELNYSEKKIKIRKISKNLWEKKIHLFNILARVSIWFYTQSVIEVIYFVQFVSSVKWWI